MTSITTVENVSKTETRRFLPTWWQLIISPCSMRRLIDLLHFQSTNPSYPHHRHHCQYLSFLHSSTPLHHTQNTKSFQLHPHNQLWNRRYKSTARTAHIAWYTWCTLAYHNNDKVGGRRMHRFSCTWNRVWQEWRGISTVKSSSIDAVSEITSNVFAR